MMNIINNMSRVRFVCSVDDFVTERGCSMLMEGITIYHELCTKSLKGKREVFVCHCRGNLCNSADRLLSHYTPLLVSVAATLIEN